MEDQGIHGLTAAYALDALDEQDELEYEEHLRTCESCRDGLAALTETATSLAYAVEAPAPPAALRERILEQARAERSNVVPLRPRRRTAPIAAVAAAAAVVVVALGAWAISLRGDLDETREALDRERDVAAVVSRGDARSLELAGADGRLVVARDGEAALLVSGLGEAPAERRYEMWVIRGGRPQSAGTFEVEEGGRAAVRLGRDVAPGSTFAVTLEPEDGGTPGPDGEILFSVGA
jgi:anti-sigma-K factor RskA